MPPKKKDATTTRDLGIDPPEPLQYDPFDLDNTILRTAGRHQPGDQRQNFSTDAPLTVRDDIISKLKCWMEDFARSLNKSRMVGHRFQCV